MPNPSSSAAETFGGATGVFAGPEPEVPGQGQAHANPYSNSGEKRFEPGSYVGEGAFVFVRNPLPSELAVSYRMLVAEVGTDVAPFVTVQNVFAHNPLSWWMIFKCADETRVDAQAVGLCAYLPLNAVGFAALKRGDLNARDPDLALVAPSGEDPQVLYLWAIVAHGLSDIAGKLVGHAIGLDLYERLPMFGTIGTEAGLAALRRSSKSASDAAALKVGSPFEIKLPPHHLAHQRAMRIWEGTPLGAWTSKSASCVASEASAARNALSGSAPFDATPDAPLLGGLNPAMETRAPGKSHPPLEGGSKFASAQARSKFRGGANAEALGDDPSPKNSSPPPPCGEAEIAQRFRVGGTPLPTPDPSSLRYDGSSSPQGGGGTDPAHGQHARKSRPVLSARVAASPDDIAKIFALRAAVFMAEQDCPYEEEFDGNDYAGTQLLGLVDGQPAATLRIRYFADFVKIERLAVLPRYRRTLIARAIVEFGLTLVRRKGYTRMYGHSQSHLVNFWRKFGFAPMEKNTRRNAPFAFSGRDYVEIEGTLPPHAEPLTMMSDPMTLIRPEGRWDEPGVLDRSAANSLREAHPHA